MRKTLFYIATLALLATFAAADQSPAAAESGPIDGEARDRISAVQLFADDGSFEVMATFPDWTEMSLGVFEVPAGGPWFLQTLRVYMHGTGNHEVVIADADGTGIGNPPHDLVQTGIHFSPGIADPADADWRNVDLGSLALVLRPGTLVCVGASFATVGSDAIGFDESCGIQGQCGDYWSYWNGDWFYDPGQGYNVGLRVVLTGPTGLESVTLSALKAYYR